MRYKDGGLPVSFCFYIKFSNVGIIRTNTEHFTSFCFGFLNWKYAKELYESFQTIQELLWWLRVCFQFRRPGFDPWVGKIPWWRKWQPTSVLLPGEFHGQRSLVSPSPRGSKESDTIELLTFQTIQISNISNKYLSWMIDSSVFILSVQHCYGTYFIACSFPCQLCFKIPLLY